METNHSDLLAPVGTGTADGVVDLPATGATLNVAAGAPGGEPAEFKHSPLVVAIAIGSTKGVAALLVAQANTRDTVDEDSSLRPGALVDNALHHLIDNCTSLPPDVLRDIGKLILTTGLDVDERDATGYTALHRAVFYNHMDSCRLLLDHGADPTIASHDRDQTTPIEVAVELDRPAIVELFMQACATRKIEMARLLTPLHWLAQSGEWDAKLLRLLNLGLDINACDSRGNRPLDLLPRSGESHLNAFYAYVAAGAVPTSALLYAYGEDSLLGEALRTDRLQAAVSCGCPDLVGMILLGMPATAGSSDVANVQSAALSANAESVHHLRQWLGMQAAASAMAEIQAFEQTSAT